MEKLFRKVKMFWFFKLNISVLWILNFNLFLKGRTVLKEAENKIKLLLCIRLFQNGPQRFFFFLLPNWKIPTQWCCLSHPCIQAFKGYGDLVTELQKYEIPHAKVLHLLLVVLHLQHVVCRSFPDPLFTIKLFAIRYCIYWFHSFSVAHA